MPSPPRSSMSQSPSTYSVPCIGFPFHWLQLLFVFLLFSVVSNLPASSAPPPLSENLDWLETQPAAFPIRNQNCEACQILSVILTQKLAERLPSSHPLSSKHIPPNDAPSHTSVAKAKTGLIDVLAQEIMDQREELCGFGLWKEYADKTEDMFVYDLTAICKAMLSENEEALETYLPKAQTHMELSKHVCVGGDLEFCGSGKNDTEVLEGKHLWKTGDFPDDRETKQMRNKRLADLFLEYNAKQPGVKTTPSGLQYKQIDGVAHPPSVESPKREKGPLCPKSSEATVKVHYIGRLLTNKEFDSSYKRNEPAEFAGSQVVSGFREGLQLMCEGDQMEFFLPGNLAYGETGAGKDVAPNMALKFYVHLIEVVRDGKTREEIEEDKKAAEEAAAKAQEEKEQKLKDEETGKDTKPEGEAPKMEAKEIKQDSKEGEQGPESKLEGEEKDDEL